METSIREKVEQLNALGIDVYDIMRRDNIIGGGISFVFWLEEESQIYNLPQTGEWAANTSLAIVKPTGQTFALGRYGWDPFGG